MTNKSFIQNYINRINEKLEELHEYKSGAVPYDYESFYDVIREIVGVFNELDDLVQLIIWNQENAVLNANIVLGRLNRMIIDDERVVVQNKTTEPNLPIIFLSHKSDDKKYADALEKFIMGLGVNENQLIYTSHPLHKIPMDENIYDYLRKHINTNVFIIFLFSNEYLKSPACMNEMGAAWVVQSDYTNIYTPDFSFGNPLYRQCAIDTNKMGAVLNGDEHCKASMIEFKDKIQNLFGLSNDEIKNQYLIDRFIKEISGVNE